MGTSNTMLYRNDSLCLITTAFFSVPHLWIEWFIKIMAYLETELHSFMLKQSYYLEVRDQWAPQGFLLLSE